MPSSAAPAASIRCGITAASAGPGQVDPAELTTFVGRERELEELDGLLAGTRLLTLTGPGGGGKTRLAVRLAGTVPPPGDRWFVALDAYADPRAPVCRGAVGGSMMRPGLGAGAQPRPSRR